MAEPRAAHPVAALFPMLGDDELSELAADIAERGLLHPVVLDAAGQVLDGRNRLAACERAGVEPRFETYDGDDPAGYALAVNIARRHLTKGQQAMIIACSDDNDYPGSEVSRQYVSWARTVLRYAEGYRDAVLSGATTLREAYDVALKNRRESEGHEAQLARLRSEDPELADRVVEGDLSLKGAWAEREARAAEEQRQRRVATGLFDAFHTVADMAGVDAARLYEPSLAVPGRRITGDVIDRARQALDETEQTLKDRGVL